jgi:CheY-like chemotaxis protein
VSAAATAPGTVVVVEDEEDTRELLRELLEGAGFQVKTAEDGLVALDVLRSTSPVCMVLVDLLMPRMNGLELIHAIAADPGLAQLHVVVSTSAPDKAPAGIPCLPKPVDISSLLAVVAGRCAPTPA